MIFQALRESNFIIYYDGLVLLLGILAIVNGIWGNITPIVQIDEGQITLKVSITKTIFKSLNQPFELDKENQVLEIDGYSFNIKLISASEIDSFIDEITKLIEEKKPAHNNGEHEEPL